MSTKVINVCWCCLQGIDSFGLDMILDIYRLMTDMSDDEKRKLDFLLSCGAG